MDATASSMTDQNEDDGSGAYPEPSGDYPKTRRAIQDGILALLEEGRETTGSLARQLGVSSTHVRRQMEWLRDEWGYVRYHDEPTALHELAPSDEREDN